MPIHKAWGSSNNSRNGQNIIDTLDQLELVFLNDGSPTRISPPGGSKSVVDISLISMNIAAKSTWKIIQDMGSSDHYATQCTIGLNINPNDNTINKRNFYKANWPLFNYKLQKSLSTFPCENYDTFIDEINNAIKETVPLTNNKKTLSITSPGGMKLARI